MALVQIPAPSAANDYQLLNAGGTSLTNSTAITVDGISAKSLMIVVRDASTVNNSSNFTLRLNGDSGTNYQYYGLQANDAAPRALSTTNTTSATSLFVGGAGSSTALVSATILIDGCATGGIKPASIFSFATSFNNSIAVSYGGVYSGTSAVTSVSLLSSSGNFDAGTMFVYGAR